MGSVGTPELLLILVIFLLLFGPQKLPEFGKSLGRAIREFKKASQELQETIEREVNDLQRQTVQDPPKAPAELPKGALPPPSYPRPPAQESPQPPPPGPSAPVEPPPPTEPS